MATTKTIVKRSLKALDTATVTEAVAIRASIAIMFGEEVADYLVCEFLKKLRE